MKNSTLRLYRLLKCLFVVTLLLARTGGYAQVSLDYDFGQSSGVYNPITGGTALDSATFDDNVTSVNTPSFKYEGTTYNQIQVSTNGFIGIGTNFVSSFFYQPISSTNSNPGFICPFAVDLINANLGNPEVRYKVVGTEIVVQWQDVMRNDFTTTTLEQFSFQLRIDTITGVIRIIYDAVLGSSTWTNLPQVGLRGPTNTFPDDINNRTIGTTGSWALSQPGLSNADLMYFSSIAPIVTPSSGQTYIWSPVKCKKIRATTLIVQNADSAIMGWQMPKDTPLGYIWRVVLHGAGPTGVAVAKGYVAYPKNYVSTGGVLAPGTSYDFYIRRKCTATDTSNYSDPTTIITPCTGTPTAGTVSGINAICASTTFTLKLNGSSAGANLQWQSSPDSIAWSDITGETADTLLTSIVSKTYYRVKVSCTNSAFTAGHVVNQNSKSLCYCNTNLGGFCNTGSSYIIDNVSIATTPLNNNSTCGTNASGDVYVSYPDTGSATATLHRGNLYSLKATLSSNFGGVGVWIDYDHSGTFDASEFTALTFVGTTTTLNTSITIPNSALLGKTGMRVRSYFTTPVGTDACNNLFDGETEDYLITIDTLPHGSCTNPPVAGTLSASPVSCRVTTVTVTGYTTGTDLQWQSSPDSITWSNIIGATSSVYTDSPLVTTFYRLKVKCIDSVYTSVYKMMPSISPSCYCTSNLGGGCGSNDIDTLVIPKTTFLVINHICNTTANGQYSVYFAPPASNTCTLQADTTYTIHIGTSGTGTGTISSLWIDYDHSLTYDANEWTQITVNAKSGTASFKVPSTAKAGLTGMRVRSRNQGNPNGASDACTGFGSGETNDFIINITTAPHSTCTNPPVPGVITMSSPSCGVFTLSDTGTSSAPYLQWQQSPDSIAWVNIIGDTTASITVSPIHLTYYRVKAKCVDSAYTAGYRIDSAMLTSSCYCISNLGGSCSFSTFDTLAIVGTTLLTADTLCHGTYIAYPPTGSNTATLTVGSNYTLNVAIHPSQTGQVEGWIDYDRNGVYDPTEYFTFAMGGTSGSVAITIPTYTKGGITGMRIRSNNIFSTLNATDACTNYFDGVTHDYLLTMVRPAVIPCPGTLTAGLLSGDSGICLGKPARFSLSGYTANQGIQWQSSPDSLIWSNITGAVQPTLLDSPATAMYYRAYVYCDTHKVYSNIQKVSINTWYECYCSGNLGGGCSFAYAINNVTIVNTPLNNSSGCSSGSAFGIQSYTLYPPSPTTTATLYRGSSYNLQVTVSSATSATVAGAWIDFNQDGVFASNEFTYISIIGGVGSAYVQIPSGALLGKTGMRIRTNYYSTTSNTMKPTDPCTHFFDGETEDYVLTIDTLPAVLCPNPPTAGVITGQHTFCPGISVSLNLTAYSQYAQTQWQFSLDSLNWFNLTGATTPTVSVSPLIPLYYRVAVSCSSTSYSAGFLVSEAPITQCYCNSNLGGFCGNYTISNVKVLHTTLDNNSGCGANPAGDYYTQFPDTGSATTTLYRTVPHDFRASLNSAFGAAGVWVDYDHSGTYDANEFTNLTYIGTTTIMGGQVTIPATAKLGKTGMRVRSNFSITSNDACTNFFDGETEDYLITIDTLPSTICSTPPLLVGGKPVITDVTCFGHPIGAIKDSFTWTYNYPYWHNWSTGDTAASLTAIPSGVYYDTMSFAFICTKILGPDTVHTATKVVAALDSSIAVRCSGDSNGRLYITVSGGQAPYKHKWNSNDTIEDPHSLYAGIYYDSITDGLSCITLIGPDTVSSPGLLAALYDSSYNVSCLGGVNDGRLYIHVIGGVGPFKHHWSNGAMTEDITNLGVGFYSDTITDAHGCTFIYGPDQITQPATAIVATIDSAHNITCYGGSNGAIYTTATGGTPPYSYTWAGTTSIAKSVSNPDSLAAGGYTLTVSDAKGCNVKFTTPTTLSQGIQIRVKTDSIKSTLCAGQNKGAIYTHTDSAVGTVHYLWSNGLTTQNIVLQPAGIYLLVVTDSNGCTAASKKDTITATIAFGAKIDSSKNVKCPGGNDGYAHAIPVGGSLGFSYSWSIGSVNPQLVNISAGPYTVSITDGLGCTASATVNITQPAAITITIDSTHNANCAGSPQGAVYITVAGGTAPYQYQWSTGAKTRYLTGVTSNTYNVSVTDTNNCTMSSVATVSPGTSYTITDTVKNVSCLGGSNASIHVGVTGAIGVVTYSWSNGSHLSSVTGLASGAITLTVTDGSGCATTKVYNITAPATALTVSTVSGGGRDSAVVAGGVSPYTYSWTAGATTAVIHPTFTGKYCVTVTDAAGCVVSTTTCDSIAAGINDIDNFTAVNIYPNPSTGHFNIDIELAEATANAVHIYAADGQLVYVANKDASHKNHYVVNLGDEASGIYIIHISAGGASLNKRISVIK